jgi:hypothetical protein
MNEITVILHCFQIFCHSDPDLSGEESSRNAFVLLERTGFFVGKPPQNDKKQVSHYPVIAMERIVHYPCAVSVPTCRDRNDGRKYDKVRQADG